MPADRQIVWIFAQRSTVPPRRRKCWAKTHGETHEQAVKTSPESPENTKADGSKDVGFC